MAKITVSDLVRSYKFYTEILGLKLVQSPILPMAGVPTPGDNDKEFVELALNYTGSLRDPMLILIKKRGVMPIPAQAAQTWLAFKVPDGPAVMSAASRAGIKPLRPYEPEKRMGFIPDPDGYTVEVLQLPSF
jgi:catechol 2,3-dioxygenase-like lactoylglutathione lyase family enzyme